MFGGRVVVSNRVGIGVGAFDPTAMLHIDGTGINADPNQQGRVLRLDGLTQDASLNTILAIDANGYVRTKQLPSINTGTICSTPNWMPKYSSNPNNQLCSQIYDNGGLGNFTNKTVAIGYSNAATRSYVFQQNPQLQGSSAPPATGRYRLDVNGVIRALAVFVTSDKNMKKDIKPLTNSLKIIKALNGVSYYWNNEVKDLEVDNTKQLGFIAQEVEKVLPEVVFKDDEGNYSMNYTMLIPILTEAIKEQINVVEKQQKQIEELKTKLSTIENDMDKCCEHSKQTLINVVPPVNDIKLFQNNPNPFTESTEIHLSIPEHVIKASLVVYDLNGRELRKIDINERNESVVKINAKELAPGMYIYTLIAENKEIDSKRMILTGN